MKEYLVNFQTWFRGFFMLVFLAIYIVLRWVIFAVIIFQFGSTLLTGQLNERLLSFSDSLSVYAFQIIRYLSYNSDDKPFPFRSWPKPSEAPILD